MSKEISDESVDKIKSLHHFIDVERVEIPPIGTFVNIDKGDGRGKCLSLFIRLDALSEDVRKVVMEDIHKNGISKEDVILGMHEDTLKEYEEKKNKNKKYHDYMQSIAQKEE